MNKKKFIAAQLSDSAAIKQKTIETCTDPILRAESLIVASLRNRGKLLFCGNGGSAADAQHLAAELVIRLSHDITRPGLPAISLSTDTSILTAGGNDIGFENVFARQVEALGHPEDVLIAITTSGNSPNIIKAMEMARSKQIKSVVFTGGSGGKCAGLADIPIIVPSDNTQRIQEAHITLGHILLELVERDLFG